MLTAHGEEFVFNTMAEGIARSVAARDNVDATPDQVLEFLRGERELKVHWEPAHIAARSTKHRIEQMRKGEQPEPPVNSNEGAGQRAAAERARVHEGRSKYDPGDALAPRSTAKRIRELRARGLLS